MSDARRFLFCGMVLWLATGWLTVGFAVDPPRQSDGSAPEPLPTKRAPEDVHGDGADCEEPAANEDTLGDWTVNDVRGRPYAATDFAESQILVFAFMGTECPLARLYAPRLQSIATAYSDRAVSVIAVFSNRQDSLTEISAFGRRHGLQIPLLKDTGNVLADKLAAQRTPEVLVLDQSRRVRYRGRIDDQYGVGYARSSPENEDLKAALESLLAGQQVSGAQTEAVGCLIGRVRQPNAASPVTYSNQIARLLQKHCVECHREGEIAPFSLTDYDEVAGWAAMIQEVVHEQRMPPWHANPKFGHFQNERLLTPEEKRLLNEWVAHGAPEGDPSQLPEPREFVSGWNLPADPDVVIPMRDRPYEVAAEGTIEYQYFAVDPGFQEDRWIAATDISPGNRAIVHHAIVFVSPPPGRSRSGLGWLAAYAPGQGSMRLPKGQARLVPAGSKLIFQMHYTPNGSPQQDLTKLGLVFADPAEVTEQVVTLIAVEPEFEIPAGARDFQVETEFDRWPVGGRLLSIAPHMHLRGKSFRVETISDEGRPEILLDVPGYDFNWQNAYRLLEPRPVSRSFRVRCTATFDNSEDNLVNPDPNIPVEWGDQSWEEMMVAFFEVAIPRRAETGTTGASGPNQRQRGWAQRTADDLFKRFDKNQDGRIEREETPESFAAFAFRRMDANRDRSITPEEAYDYAIKRAPR